MIKMLPREYVLYQITHRETNRIPFTLAFEGTVWNALNNYYQNVAWNKSLNPYIRYVASIDNNLVKYTDGDMSVDAYGSTWNNARWHIDKPALPDANFENYTFPDSSVFTRQITDNISSIEKSCKENSGYFRVINMGWGIFERSWIMRGFENALADMLAEPTFYRELTERITDIYVEGVRACKDVDADAILFGDDWGDQRGVIMGAELWRKFIKPCWKRVYEEVHKQNKIVMSHSCGSIYSILGDAIDIGLDVYESVQPEPDNMNPYDLKKEFGNDITFWGCLGTQRLLPFGKPDEIISEIDKLCENMGKGGGYILAPAKPLQEDMPLENILAVVEKFKSLIP